MTVVVIEGGVDHTLCKVLSVMIPDLLIVTSMPDPPPPKLSELFEAPKFEVPKKPENPFKPIPPWDRRFRR